MGSHSVLESSRNKFLRIVISLIIVGSILRPLIIFFFQLGEPAFVFNGIVFILSSLLYVLLVYQKRLLMSSWIMIAVSLFATIYLVYETLRTSLVSLNNFIIIFPLVSIFLFGKHIGIITSIIEIVLIGCLGVFMRLSSETLFQGVFNILIAIFILYFYQDMEEQSQQILSNREKELETVVSKLEKQKEELEHLNAIMVGRELNMAEMKNKMKQMEEQLSKFHS